jgi:hypothetical protein
MMLPVDARLSKLVVEDGRGAQSCSSEALAKQFAALGKTGCAINYVFPTTKTVSFVTIALSSASVASGVNPQNPCAGSLTWSQDVGAVLARAQSFMDRIGGLNENDPQAVATLRSISGDFAALADEQAKATTPPVMSVANDRVVATLRAYASAVNQAANGINANDAAVVDDAVANLASANDAAARASVVIQRAILSCGLTPGTPVAAS